MLITDAQVHIWAADRPDRWWPSLKLSFATTGGPMRDREIDRGDTVHKGRDSDVTIGHCVRKCSGKQGNEDHCKLVPQAHLST